MPVLHASLVRSILTEAAVNVAPRGAVEGNMNRRTAVGVLGSLAFGTVAEAWGRRALAQPVCTLTPEQIEGPFYLDQARIREAISEGKPGVPLQLVLRLRGTQLTGGAGGVRFRTIYQGWYPGRTPHVHLKLRVGAKAATTQLYFPDEVTNAVYARAPYDRHPNRDTTNTTDRFLGSIADKSLVMWTMARDGDGYIADATVAFRTS